MTRINRKGFYCACDRVYFETLAKTFVLSAKKHAPWAHVHLHLFDGTVEDQIWAEQYGATVTLETTPDIYKHSHLSSCGYWVNMRFVRLSEIYEDSVPVISIDADSVFSRALSEQEFDQDLLHSWVTTAPKREQKSLGSAVGFAPDSARHCLKEKLLALPQLEWYQDQIIMDQLLAQGVLTGMDMRYSDFKMKENSYIWTGKGERKFKLRFQQLCQQYHA